MMKKKFVIGLLLATLGVGAVTLPSCKDTAEDEIAAVKGEQATLQELFKQLQTTLGQCQANCSTATATALQDYYKKTETYNQQQINGLLNDLAQKYAALGDFTKLKEEVDKLLTNGGNGVLDLEASDVKTLEDLADALQGKGYDIADVAAMGQFAKDAGTLANIIANAASYLTSADLADYVKTADLADYLKTGDLTKLNEAVFGKDGVEGSGLINSVAALTTRIEGLETIFTKEDGTLLTAAEFKQLLEAGNWVIANKQGVESVVNAFNDLDNKGLLSETALQALKDWVDNGTIADLTAAYNQLFPDGLPADDEAWYTYPELLQAVAKNASDIAALQSELAKLQNTIKKLVTGLEIHTAWNPILGGFNTPFGISSDILLGFYGRADQSVVFPTDEFEDAGLKGNVFASLGTVETETIGGNIYDKNLGTLYFTANPVGAVVEPDAFSFENSLAVAAPVQVAVKKSDKLINMGFSRAAAGNNFYEAAVSLTDENEQAGQDIQALKINVEHGLLQKVKDVMSSRSLGSVASLAKGLYNQLQDVCPAYALRYDWSPNEGEEYAVLSRYGVAVATAKPLSFTTLRGESFNNPLPENIGHIQIEKDIADLNLKPFEVGKFELNIALSIESIQINNVDETTITVRIPNQYVVNDQNQIVLPNGWDVTGSGYYDEMTVNIEDELNEVIAGIRDSIDKWLKGTPETAEEAAKPGLAEQIQNQVQQAVDEAFNGKGKPGDPDYKEGFATKIESQVNEMMGTIQDKLYSLIDDINGEKYLGRLNRVIDLYNKWNDRLTHVLSQPNHYLQVCMLYNTKSEGVGFLSTSDDHYTPFKYNGGEGFNVWATTYNFETVCPSYKKFVAVTNIKEDGNDITTPAVLAKLNASDRMAKVVDGCTKAFTVTTPSDVIKNGHVYALEITYRAIDYQGKTSTSRYFITINAK